MEPLKGITADSEVFAHLASAAIPVAGTYTNQAFSALSVEVTRLACFITYAKNVGFATGQPRFRLEWQDAALNTWSESILDATAVVAAEPRGRMKTYLGEWDGPIFTAAVIAGTFVYTFEKPPGAIAFRLLLTEITANAGTAQVDYAVSGQL